MELEEETEAAGDEARGVPFFAVLLLGLAERLGVTAGNGDGGSGLDGWVLRLGRTVLLLTTPAGMWQADTGAWASWDAPELEWQLLHFASAPDAFERAVARHCQGGEAIVTLTHPLLSLPERRPDLEALLLGYAPPDGIDHWSRGNRRLYEEIAAAVEQLDGPQEALDAF